MPTHRIAIVLHEDFSDKLEALSESMHVWVRSTPQNMREAKRIWNRAQSPSRDPEYDPEFGVTTFEVLDSESAVSMFLEIFETIDDHHNAYVYDDGMGWSYLEAHGIKLVASIRACLAEFGDMRYEEIRGGFRCWKT